MWLDLHRKPTSRHLRNFFPVGAWSSQSKKAPAVSRSRYANCLQNNDVEFPMSSRWFQSRGCPGQEPGSFSWELRSALLGDSGCAQC